MNKLGFEELQNYITTLDTSSPESYPKALLPVMAVEGTQRRQLAEIVAKQFGLKLEDVLNEVELSSNNKPLHELIEDEIQSLSGTPKPEEIEQLCQDIASVDNDIFRQHLIALLASKTKQTLTKGDIKRRVSKIREEFLSIQVHSSSSTHVQLNRPNLIQVKQKVPDAPVPEGLGFPPKHTINERGEIVFEGDKFVEYVCPVPLFITRRVHNLDDGTMRVELVYRIKDEWKRIVVPKSTVADSRKIVQLADVDVPVSSANSRLMVRYLQDFEAWNLEVLPTVESVRSLGWRHWRGKRVYVWGNHVIGADGATLLVDPESPGEEQLVEALSAGGTWDGWLNSVFAPALNYPAFRLAIYAALAAPMLEAVKVHNFVFHLAGRSSSGKTTAAQVAISVAGYPGGPGLPDRPGLYRPWNTTDVAPERIFALLNNIPAYFDDSTEVRKDEQLARILYMFSNGQGRSRGAVRGMQRTANWSTVLISTGEKSLGEVTRLAGAKARAIDWIFPPFEGAAAGDDLAKIAEAFKASCATHYGHALPRFVATLLTYDKERLFAEHRAVTQRIREQVREHLGEPNELVDRLAGAFGAIALAGGLFHELTVPAQFRIARSEIEDFVAQSFARLVGEERPEHTHVAAYREVLAWAARNRESFYDRNNPKPQPPNGWLGVWPVHVTGMLGEFIGIAPDRLRECLGSWGYPYESVLRQWRDEGLLIPDYASKQLTRVVRYGNGHGRVVVLRIPDDAEPGDNDLF